MRNININNTGSYGIFREVFYGALTYAFQDRIINTVSAVCFPVPRYGTAADENLDPVACTFFYLVIAAQHSGAGAHRVLYHLRAYAAACNINHDHGTICYPATIVMLLN